MSTEALVNAAVEQIKFARGYVQLFLNDLAPEDWFWQPAEGVTHLAWQVGHLAMAEYRLALARVRGKRPEDEALISRAFLQHFGKGAAAQPGAANNPPVEEIVAVFDRVHEQVLAEIPRQSPADWHAPPHEPHFVFTTRLGAIAYCSHHEMIHAGQIALLRRLMGKEPLR